MTKQAKIFNLRTKILQNAARIARHERRFSPEAAQQRHYGRIERQIFRRVCRGIERACWKNSAKPGLDDAGRKNLRERIAGIVRKGEGMKEAGWLSKRQISAALKMFA